MLRRISKSAVLATIGLLATAGVAAADPFAIHTVLRNYCCDDWTGNGPPTSAANPGGGAFGFKGGQIVQPATVARTVDQDLAGGAPFAMTIPPSRIGTQFSVIGFNHPNPLFDILDLSVDMTNLQGAMAANAGPGDFEFCPLAVGPGAAACAFPGAATGGPMSLAVHGRFDVTAGVNQFGGAMGWLGAGLVGVIDVRDAPGAAAVTFSSVFFAAPFSVVGDGTTSAGIVAMQEAPTAPNIIYTTSMHGDFTGTPMQNPAWVSTVMGSGAATGHIWTTGTVIASITTGNSPPFQAVTLTGSDNRVTTGPDIGSGNLTLVSGNLYQGYVSAVPQVRGNSIQMTLPEPGTGLAVAAGAFVLVLTGLARRRRQE